MLKVWNKLWYGGDVRPVKVKSVDLQRNAARIQEAITKTQSEIRSLTEQMNNIDLTSESGKIKYEEIRIQIEKKHHLYSVLQEEMKLEIENLKRLKDSKTIIPVKDAVMIGSLMFIGLVAISLERENPRAIKLAQLILKIFPLHI